jgi:uncharacterized membrane protein
METKKSKYDTNPLDPDFVKQTEEVGSDADNSRGTQEVKGATRETAFSANEQARGSVYSEAPTRRYDNVPLDAPYPSIFIPPTYSQAAPYQPPATPYRPVGGRPTARSVPGIGLPEKWALLLPYLPFYIGVVPAVLELFLVPRREVNVRFHAAQALSLHIAILLLRTLFGLVAMVTGSSIGGSLFGVVSLVFLIVSMARVWKGKAHHVTAMAEPAKWFNEHIEPRGKS